MKRVLSIAFALLCVAPSARAQSDVELAKAEGLFKRGVDLLEKHEVQKACQMFDESRKIVVGIGTLLYLADCNDNLGRHIEAARYFRDAERLARERKDGREAVARKHAVEVEAKVGRLSLRRRSGPEPSRVMVGPPGRLEPVTLGEPLLLEPGTYAVRTLGPTGLPWEGSVEVHAGALAELAIDVVAAAEPVAAPPPAPIASPVPVVEHRPEAAVPPVAEPADAKSVGGTQRTLGLVSAGVGVVGLVVGVVGGISASSKQSESASHCNAGDRCDPTGLDLRSSALGAARLSTLGFVVGGVALAGGAALYLTAPRSSGGAAAALAPAVGTGVTGLVVTGRF